jgi:Uma2 family endonuclease
MGTRINNAPPPPDWRVEKAIVEAEGIELIHSDGIPMESFWHVDAMEILRQSVACFLSEIQKRSDFIRGGNNFVYFSAKQAKNRDFRGPDFFVVLDVPDPERRRKSWVLWDEEGRTPNVVVELGSQSTIEEDRTTKFDIYERTLKVKNYYIVDRETEIIQGWKLVDGVYQELAPNFSERLEVPELGLEIGQWDGHYAGRYDRYPRFFYPNGRLVPMPSELAIEEARQQYRRLMKESARADQESQRAEEATEKAAEAVAKFAEATAIAAEATAKAEEAVAKVAEITAVAHEAVAKVAEVTAVAAEATAKAAEEKRRADELEQEVARLRASLAQPKDPNGPRGASS